MIDSSAEYYELDARALARREQVWYNWPGKVIRSWYIRQACLCWES